MTKEEQLDIYRGLDEKINLLAKLKGEDYAGEDILSNFKTVSVAAKSLKIDVTTPTGYALFMVLLKISRINNLLTSGKTPNNESIADSFEDAINYMKLAYCCHIDENKN